MNKHRGRVKYYDMRVSREYGIEVYTLVVLLLGDETIRHTFLGRDGLDLKLREYGLPCSTDEELKL
jgi:hypothetical protein